MHRKSVCCHLTSHMYEVNRCSFLFALVLGSMKKALDPEKTARISVLIFVIFLVWLLWVRARPQVMGGDAGVAIAEIPQEATIHGPLFAHEMYGRYPHDPLTRSPFSFETVLTTAPGPTQPFEAHVVIAQSIEKLNWVSNLGPDIHTHVVHLAQIPRALAGINSTGFKAWRAKKKGGFESLFGDDEGQYLNLLETVPDDSTTLDVAQLVQFPPSRATVYTIDGSYRGSHCLGWVYWIIRNYDALPPRVAFLRGHATVDNAPTLDSSMNDRAGARFYYMRRVLLAANLTFELAHELPPLSRRCYIPDGSLCCGYRDDIVGLLNSVGLSAKLGPREPTLDKEARDAAIRDNKFIPFNPPLCPNMSMYVSAPWSAQYVVAAERIRTLKKEHWVRVLRFLLSPVAPWRPSPERDADKHHEPFKITNNCEALAPFWHVFLGETADMLRDQYVRNLIGHQVGRWRDWDAWMVRPGAVKLRRFDWTQPPRDFPVVRKA